VKKKIPKKQAVGIRAIAERAKVSISAVSKVLNAYENFSVGADTRARILKAVEDLGYRPDAAARTLRRRKSDTVGFLVHSFEGFSLELLGQLEKRLRRRGLGIEVACSEFDAKRELDLLRHFENRLCDGVFVVTAWQARTLPMGQYLAAMPKAMPVVYLDSNLPHESIRAVVGDNQGDAARAARALAALGVKRFYYTGSNLDLPVLAQRREGFQSAVAGLNLPRVDMGALAWEGDEAQVFEKWRVHFAGAPAGSCTFFESLGALRRQLPALIASGRQFGEDLILSGFDEPVLGDALGFFTQHRGLFTRPISYIEQNASAMVEAALELLARGPGQPGGVTRIPGILRHFS